MKTRPLSKIEKLAAEAAISAPVIQGKYSVDATVPWVVIREIRTELERLGVDWKDIRKRMIQIRDERLSAAMNRVEP